jgi:hypothetical protein
MKKGLMIRQRLLSSPARSLAILVVCFGLSISSCGTSPGIEIDQPEAGHAAGEDLLEGRSFLLGMVPSPKTIPDSTFEDLGNAYQEVAEIADVVMIWGNPGGIGLYDRLLQSQVVTAVRVYDLQPVLTLNFHTIKEIPGQGLGLVIDAPEGINPEVSDPVFRERWIAEAKMIAQEFEPEYFSLGNEINDYFLFHPEDVDVYLSLFDSAYREIKEVSPDTKVFVVFSYNHLIDNHQWELLEIFSTHVDLIGLTTYPWQHYASPEEIDMAYYSQLNDHLDRPIAFTEIGWPSTSSEQDQAAFLTRFVELIAENEVEMVNWLFLHEMDVTEGIGRSIFSPETGSIGLKSADGRKKLVYKVWVDLYLGGVQ